MVPGNPKSLLYALAIAAIVIGAESLGCREITVDDATASERPLLGNFSHVLKCSEVSGLVSAAFIWRPISLDVDCGKLQTFNVYVGPHPDALLQRCANREGAWCSLSSYLQTRCELQLSPFSPNYIGVRKSFNTGVKCRFRVHTEWSTWMIGSCLVGAAIFLLANPLSVSMALRVTSGGLLFALCSVLILIYVVSRQMPGRRSMMATTTVLGFSSLSLVRWMTGYWVPSIHALLHNPFLMAYLAVSGLIGAAVTYLYGGVENTKLNTLIRTGLRLLGLLLLYSGTWTQPAVFMTLVALAVLAPAVQSLASLVPRQRTRGMQLPGGPVPAAANQDQPPATPLGGPSPEQRAHGQGRVANGTPAPSTTPAPLTPMPLQYAVQTPPKEEGGLISPLVRKGFVVHPLTGVLITIGSDEYNSLVEQGFTIDLAAGRLCSPSNSRR